MRRFNFKHTFNLRELGGYEAQEGTTKSHVFLRSDNLSHLSNEEIETLKKYGLKTIVDLRHDHELEAEPDPFAKDPQVDYLNISVTDYASFTTADLNEILLSDLYITMAENTTFIQTMFETLADSEGTLLFHCSAGKDRTGFVSALLLKLVGVSDFDIVADYEVSTTYLIPKYEPMDFNPAKEYPSLYASKPETMFTFLSYLKKTYGTIEAYFAHHKVSDETLNRIKAKFIERTPL